MFRRKVTIVLTLVNTALILSLAAATYPKAFEDHLDGMRHTVRGIAATASLAIDGDLHQTIPPDPSAKGLPAYQELQGRLRRILGMNPGLRYVWTMVKGPRAGETIFVGDVGGKEPSPGLKYDASAAPDLWNGFNGPAADRKLVKDPWGVSISGYAPIRNRAGHVVALLGVDAYGQQIDQFQQSFRRSLALSLGVGILLAVLLGGIVARWIARPLDRLVHGMRRVEAGELTHEVQVATGDEFQEAAAAFNRMTRAVKRAREDLKESLIRAIRSLMLALEAKDPYTRGHSESVTQYAAEIAKTLGKSAREIETLNRLTVLHDIGKIGIHDAVLQKPAPFSTEERQVIQRHPSIGGKILQPLDLSPEELSLIVSHHEREDGSGYPQGLDRSRISDLVAIVSVADAYDAMVSHRPHRRAMKPAEALAELHRNAGTQFRPEVVEALDRMLRRKGVV
ncbi:MAG: HD domain-containing protein [Candidatus Omnitrophica bacterium]|nr:HD domain-containing protein [Candidatus Omnitrophota bacterium]